MLKQLKSALLMFTLLVVLTGVGYPLLVTALCQGIFPWQANGSLVILNGQVVGSELIGQQFDLPGYFWGRLSATADFPYNASASGSNNYSALNPDLVKQVNERLAVLKAADPQNDLPVPVDLVTASGSGLDPDISVAAARYQVGRVARARGLSLAKVEALIDQYIIPRQLGVLGEARVNVLELNLALDGVK